MPIPSKPTSVTVTLVLAALMTTPASDASSQPALNRAQDDTTLRHWLVLGPFPSQNLEQPTPDGVTRSGFHHDYLAALGGEAAARFSVGQELSLGLDQTRAPAAISAWANGWVDAKQFSRALAYASTTVQVDQTGDYYLYCASHGSPRLWLDGKLVLSHWQDIHQARPWQHGIRVHLEAGIHHLLLKIDNRRGWWGFQVDLIPAAAHPALAAKMVKRLQISEASQITDDELRVQVELVPPALDTSVPIRVTVTDAGGASQTATGTTGAAITVPGLTQNRVMTITATTEPAAVLTPQPASREVYIGDIVARCHELAESWRTHRTRLRHDTPTMAPAIDWVDAWLAQAETRRTDDATDLSNLRYLTDLVGAADTGGNLFRSEPHTGYPCRFTGTMPDGTEIVGEYHLTAPKGLWLQPSHEPVPVLYNLHGAGGTGRRIHPYRQAWQPDHYDELDHAVTPGLRILPRATRAYRWDPDWLDLLHQHVAKTWQLDPKRVHLQGFSMGGGGTMRWALAQPERFATLTPMAFSMRWMFGDPPYDAAVAPLKGKPVWLICGGRDKRLSDTLLLHEAMRRAGVQVRLSVYGSRGHGGLESIAEAEGLSAWQAANPLPEP